MGRKKSILTSERQVLRVLQTAFDAGYFDGLKDILAIRAAVERLAGPENWMYHCCFYRSTLWEKGGWNFTRVVPPVMKRRWKK